MSTVLENGTLCGISDPSIERGNGQDADQAGADEDKQRYREPWTERAEVVAGVEGEERQSHDDELIQCQRNVAGVSNARR